MPMPHYPIYCLTPGCKNLAVYKIAARWSDGLESELKTYGLCCDDCVATWYARGITQREACRLAPGETLEQPGVFRLERTARDRELIRAREVEQRLAASLPKPGI
jgi:hypothetical protein